MSIYIDVCKTIGSINYYIQICENSYTQTSNEYEIVNINSRMFYL